MQLACSSGTCQGVLGHCGMNLLGPSLEVAALGLVLCRGGGSGSMSTACVRVRVSGKVLGVESGAGCLALGKGERQAGGLRADVLCFGCSDAQLC